uniref:Transmembrane protein n=1 Tax=Meloidogyne hapla TaxID=6305 RepID=A0A1I8B5R5_MELHA
MILSIFCAFTTIFAYLMQRQNEENFNFFEPEEFELNENEEENNKNNIYLNQTFFKKLISISASAFLIGIFGQWNLYVLLLLALYAPSHKHFNNNNNRNIQALNNEEDENLNVGIESTPLTTFLKHATD